MKRITALLSLLFVSFIAHGQDTLKILTWNILDYGNASRDQYFRTVLRHVKPDVLVVQEMTTQAMVDNFFNNVLNLVFPGQFSKGIFIDGPDTDNEIYYKTTKFTFIANTPIHTALRNISEFKMYNAAAADTCRIYSVHLKASTGYETNRAAEVDSLRKATNALPNGKYFIVCGDYNIYRSTEPAYQKLLQDNPTDDGNFVDALNLTGQWNNPSYAPHHTQSTRGYVQGPGGGSYGGLDDRFDMILYSRAANQPGKNQYLLGSLTPIGNDGLHYNDSLGHLPNNAVPDSVAIALYNASDHLPVSARFIFRGGGGISPEPTSQASNVDFNTITSSSMEVTWTNGNGTSRIVIARAGGPVSFAPSDGQAYSANSNFASATDLGSGNKAVFSGSGNSMTVTGLSSNITYHFAVYEVNGSGGTENYLTTLPATNSQRTLSVTYYSQGNLAPNLVSSWNSDRGGLGSQPSDFTSGVPFVIQNGHTMTTTGTWSISGTGSRLQIENGGMLIANQPITLASTTTFQIDNGGTYIHDNAGVPSATVFQGVESFASNSTVEIRGWVNSSTAIPSISGSWGNLKITYSPATAWNNLGNITSIAGSFTIDNNSPTNGFRFVGNTSFTLTIGGDLNIVSGLLQVSNSGATTNTFVLNLRGSYNQIGGTFAPNLNSNSTLMINLVGNGNTFTKSGGTLTDTQINWNIGPTDTLTLNNDITLASNRMLTVNGILNCRNNAVSGTGAFSLAGNATLVVESPDGINAGTLLGNIRVSGSRTFDAAANYVLDGAAAQVTGNGFPVSVNNLTINNSNGVALTGSVTANGTLALASGPLSLGASTLTLNGDIDQTNGMLSGGSSSSITFGGSGASTNLPAVSLQNLIVDRTNGISLAGPVIIFGALTVTNGSVSTGDNIISLGPVATISEPAASPILGTVTTTRTISQSVNSTFGGLGLEVNAGGASPGPTVVTRQTGIASVWNENHSILRYVDLSPETNSDLNATLVFHYEVSELNGHNAAALRLWKSTDAGSSWQLAGGTVNTSARTITVTGVSSFSRWTAADSLHFSSGQVTSSRAMNQGWNIISVPLDVTDYRKASVFPTSTSSAFAYDQTLGYAIRDTLKNGTGYWLKFPSPQTVNITGSVRNHDTLSVSTGWNLIGSTSVPVAVTAIQQIPTGIVSSSFFEYLGAYAVADSVRPATGYWVKVIQNGRLILR